MVFFIGGAAESVDGKLVEFVTSDKIILQGFLVPSRGRSTCIIFVHGMTGSFYDSKLALAIAEAALKDGVSTLMMNTRGHDAVAVIDKKSNSTDRNKRTIVAGTAYEKFEDCVYDIDAAIRALSLMSYKRFILAGHSTGCQKVAYYQYKRKDKRVIALLLYGPAEDVPNEERAKAKFKSRVNIGRLLARKRKGNRIDNRVSPYFSANRFLSFADLKNAEARVFNYGGPMKEFGSINVPILAVFGSREEHTPKPIKVHFRILREKTHSRLFGALIINGAMHSFRKHEQETARKTLTWLRSATKGKL